MATQTQEVTQRLAPFQEQFLQDIFAQASALKGAGMPYEAQQLAGLSPQQLQAVQQAQAGVGAYQPYLQAAQQYAAPGGVSQFFNPYENQVVQQTMQDIGRAGQMQQQQLGAQAVGQGAFGGSRAAVAGAELGRATMEQQARSAGQLRQQGYSQAQQAAQNAAQLQAGLGAQAQQMGVQDINTLLGIGGLTQQTSQQALDVARQNLLQQQSLPYQEIGFLSDIFRGVPALQQTTSSTTTPPPSTMSQIAGLGIAGLGAYGASQQGGGFMNWLSGGK
jgi:hypothetical protein